LKSFLTVLKKIHQPLTPIASIFSKKKAHDPVLQLFLVVFSKNHFCGKIL